MLAINLGNNFLHRSKIRKKLPSKGQTPTDLSLLLVVQLAKVVNLSRAGGCYRPRFSRRRSNRETKENQENMLRHERGMSRHNTSTQEKSKDKV